ncbi:hypothetical protein [Paenibacillus naphthalenovorans]|uniref:Uncharacterized protein n=1 Tax=Paenibacillus naphthalenovorans TaxID=162209 RepID=A0A0U2W701_9BACL|nr:hypothetical protein [Paenibacillus naphthalenovorans]ALS22222.1 hypothetical protein IJ22_18480 [Paenibacillus naphthalenovorans]
MELWINCIYVHKSEEGKWAATLIWDSIQKVESRKEQGYVRGDFKGEIQTQYFEDTLTKAVDMVLEVAKYMNITEEVISKPKIYYTEDDELLSNFPCSDDDKREIEQENIKRGWIR